MQYELRTQVIEPKRRTFDNLVARLGDRPASRYEEGSFDVQSTANFHYRPLWNPSRAIYDVDYTALRLDDPHAFTDPRKFYYAPYVTTRAALHDAFGSTLKYVDERGLLSQLPQAWQDLLVECVLPLRHYESGAQLISAYGCRFSWGTTIAQCLSYASFDRIGNAQLLGRVGLALDDGGDGLLATAKLHWMTADALQPLRRYLELLLVEQDWGIAHVGIDLVDQLLYRLLYRRADQVALPVAPGYSLLARHLDTWFADQRRWVDALYAAWQSDPVHGAANAEILRRAVARLLPEAEAAMTALAGAVEARIGAAGPDDVHTTADALRDAFAREASR